MADEEHGKRLTPRRTPIPVKITLAGGKDWDLDVGEQKCGMDEGANQSDPFSKGCRKGK